MQKKKKMSLQNASVISLLKLKIFIFFFCIRIKQKDPPLKQRTINENTRISTSLLHMSSYSIFYPMFQHPLLFSLFPSICCILISREEMRICVDAAREEEERIRNLSLTDSVCLPFFLLMFLFL